MNKTPSSIARSSSSSKSPARRSPSATEKEKSSSQSPSRIEMDESMLKAQQALDETFKGRIIRKLGQGTFGMVAECLIDGKIYAVKFSHIDWKYDLDFVREVYYSNLFNHPSIVKYVNFAIARNVSYAVIVMEMASNDLTKYLYQNGQNLSRDNKIDLMYKIGLGILYIHSQGYVHCDIKPENILMFDGENPKIGDLGLVRIKEYESTVGHSRPLCQTLLYRPPEKVFVDNPEIDFSAKDIGVWSINSPKAEYWAFGMMCLEIIYGLPNLFIHIGNPEKRYTEVISKVIQEDHLTRDTFQDLFGPVEEDCTNLLDLVCRFLLVLNQEKRDLRKFLKAIRPGKIIRTPRKGFRIGKYRSFTESEYKLIRVSLVELVRVCRQLSLPNVVVMNSIDYLIQHIHLYPTEKAAKSASLVVLFVMQSVCNIQDEPYSGNEFFSLYEYSAATFKNTGIEMTNGLHGMEFENLYQELPTDMYVKFAMRDILKNYRKYISYGSPHDYATYLFETYSDDDGIKTDTYFSI